MIRRAVGAIVLDAERILLVRKVRIKEVACQRKAILPEWDIPKGGVKRGEVSLEAAVLRELEEETGCSQFNLVRRFAEHLHFTFPVKVQKYSGYKEQETTLFLLRFAGSERDLVPDGDEIDQVRFVPLSEALTTLAHEETREFLRKHVIE